MTSPRSAVPIVGLPAGGFRIEVVDDQAIPFSPCPVGWVENNGPMVRACAGGRGAIDVSAARVLVGTFRANEPRTAQEIVPGSTEASPLARLSPTGREDWDRVVSGLDGDFSLVRITTEGVAAARDPMGVHALYYARGADRVAFASHPALLASLSWVETRVDDLRVADYLLSLYEDPVSTFSRGIKRLPAAHVLFYRNGSATTRRYWSLDAIPELKLQNDEAYVERFRHEFERSVAGRLDRGSNTGTTLSGGLDSSSVAMVAARCCGAESVRAFSAVFDASTRSDEREYIAMVLATGGMRGQQIVADDLAPLGSIRDLLPNLFEPFFAPNLFIHAALMRGARDHGCRVLLDGLDGDTSISHGIARLQELARRMAIASLARETRALARGIMHTSPGQLLWRSVVRPLVLRNARLALEKLRAANPSPWGGEANVNRDFAATFRLADRYAELSDCRQRPLKTHRLDHVRRITWPLHQFILEILARLNDALGVESRYPFYDRRLLELSVSLPSDTKLRDGWTRWILRQSMTGLLPQQVAWRVGKSDLGENFNRAFLNHELRSIIDAAANRGHHVWHYVDLDGVPEEVKKAQNGDSKAILSLWKTLTLHRWLESDFV